MAPQGTVRVLETALCQCKRHSIVIEGDARLLGMATLETRDAVSVERTMRRVEEWSENEWADSFVQQLRLALEEAGEKTDK
jgi:hypothetical protein